MKLMRMSLPSEPLKLNVIKISGPGFMTQMVVKYIKESEHPSILIVPPSYFYPVSNTHRLTLTLDNYRTYLDDVTGPIYTCHLWHASWQK
jgi:hypothetical protein